MKRLLHLDSSLRLEGSVTRQLSAELVARWGEAHPGTEVRYRDLARHPASPVDDRWIRAAFTPPDQHGPELAGALAESDQLVDELLWADVLVIGVPMYNFTVPATLKAWLDQVVRYGRTFLADAFPSRGLAGGRKVFIVSSSNNDYIPPSARSQLDHLEPYLRTVFGFMGITDVVMVRTSGQDPASVGTGIARSRQRIADLVPVPAAGPAT